MFNIKHIMYLVFAWIIALFLCSSIVNAAIISGSIYDLALQPESNVVVEINTVPKQLLVSKGGDYAFNVRPGNYILYAHTSLSGSTESLVVTDDGNYTLDIILGENMIDLTDFTLPESNISVSLDNPKEKTKNTLIILFSVVLVIFCIIGLYLFMRFKTKLSKHESVTKHDVDKHKEDTAEKPLDEYEHKVLSTIKKEKRITQKDIRREIPLSEAKISLIISDLESKGKVRKIKKGRGNILIFIKD